MARKKRKATNETTSSLGRLIYNLQPGSLACLTMASGKSVRRAIRPKLPSLQAVVCLGLRLRGQSWNRVPLEVGADLSGSDIPLSPIENDRFVIAFLSLLESSKSDCPCALQRKGLRSCPFGSCEDPFSSPVSWQLSRKSGVFRRFRQQYRGLSPQTRLRGGAGSLALTFLCPNSLLTG